MTKYAVQAETCPAPGLAYHGSTRTVWLLARRIPPMSPNTPIFGFVPALALALAACAAPPADPPAAADAADAGVKVFKARGAVQCAGRGVAPDAMRAELERAGVRVSSAGCGSDGRMRPAMCGATTGEINLFDIAAADLTAARALGFAPLTELGGGAETVPCR